jgi:signal transduction histidine kinase
LIRLERLALGGQLAAGVMHDLRKPVLNIKHSLDELSEALGDFASAAPALQDLRQQTRLFFQILSESQIERFLSSDRVGEEYVEIAPIIEFSLNLVQYERRSVEIIRRENEGLPPILARPFRLIQLFSNLILNAYQAMGGQGRLTIDATAEQGGVRVRLTDDGPGIGEDVIDHIFEPFFTTKGEGEGTGLGLAICRLILEDMGGEISVNSRLDGPTVFEVWLRGDPS